MLPKLSIIIVTYNAEKQIDSAIKSVINQSYENKELIIVDGMSSDSTMKIIKNYAYKIPYLRWISEPDKGIYDAMNKGISFSSGDWVYFLGSDDILSNNYVIETVAQKLSNEKSDFVYGDVVGSAFKNRYDGEFTYSKLSNKNISHQSIFYKRIIFEKLGTFNIRYKTHADWDFNLRCFENAGIKKKYIDVIVAEFAGGGASSTYDIAFLRESLLPRKLLLLREGKIQVGLIEFDRFWRLIRNGKIISSNQIHITECPRFISLIIDWQNKLPGKVIKIGIASKLLMFLCYIVCCSKKKI